MADKDLRTKSPLASGSFSWESVIPDPSTPTESQQEISRRKLTIDGESGKEFAFEFYIFVTAQRKLKVALCLHKPTEVKNVHLKLKVWVKGKRQLIHSNCLNTKNRLSPNDTICKMRNGFFKNKVRVENVAEQSDADVLLSCWEIPFLPLNALKKKCDVIIDMHIEIGRSEEMMQERVDFLKDTEPTLAEALKKCIQQRIVM